MMGTNCNGMNIGKDGITVSFTTSFEFTKDCLKEGDVVTLRNGEKLRYTDDKFSDLNDDPNNSIYDLSDLDDDLTYYDRDEIENDIMKVERPLTYTTMFERKEEVREMTLKEICKELGYNVKIVKEEK